MTSLDPLIADFLDWIGKEPRLYAEVMEAWRTSCPRLTVWEDAIERGYVVRETRPGLGTVIALTQSGRDFAVGRHPRGAATRQSRS